MKLNKLPSIIEETEFDEKGFAKTEEGLLVPAYVGSQLGFNEPGKQYLNDIFYPELKKRKVLPLCPFAACAEYLDLSKLNENMSLKEYTAFWEDFNKIIGPVNYESLMLHSKFMIAIFDGSHASDDGLCSEVGYFASKHGPIVGVRSDLRLAENIASPINVAIRYFIDQGPYNGLFFTTYKDSFEGIEKLAKEFLTEINL